jgi:deazaflavin-dependent oxidoreductase (nitroreductase family)
MKPTIPVEQTVPKPSFAQWLYLGHRPNWIAKILNRISAIAASSGIAANYMETLEVIGRKSGRIVSLPVVVAVVDGQRYLVSMLGDNAQWVLNVRAAGGKAVMHSGRRTPVQLESVPIDQRAPILQDYLKRAPGARPHMPIDKDAPLVDFEKIAADYPVFHIVSNQDVNR